MALGILARAEGATLQELRELGGWSSFEMVLRYAHLVADHLQVAARRVEGTTSAQGPEPQAQDDVSR